MSCFSLRKIFFAVFGAFALCCSAFAGEAKTLDLSSIKGGEVIEEKMLDTYGENSFFTLSEIPDDVWKRMQGNTYQDNPFIKREDLRYLRLLHVDHENKVRLGEMVCNRAIAEDLREIFFILYKNKYAIEHILLADEDQADLGRPLMSTRTLSTLSGYIKCADSHFDGVCTDSEKDMVNNFLVSGFYYE